MRKFKVGDKVEVINATLGWGRVRKGDIGTVVAYVDESLLYATERYAVDFEHQKGWLATGSDLRLVESSEKETCNKECSLIEKVEKIEKEFELFKSRVEQLGKIIKESGLVVSETLQDFANKALDEIEFEGKKYRRVERLADVGDVVVFTENETNSFCSTTNKPYKVTGKHITVPLFSGEDDEEYFVYSKIHKRTSDTVIVYELDKESLNQKRKEIIQKAKEFVKKHTPKNHKWIIDKENRMVILLEFDRSGFIINSGQSKCRKDDVFNEHIGKAIAVGRLKLVDTCEFENAPVPNEPIVGMIVRGNEKHSTSTYSANKTFTLTKKRSHDGVHEGFYFKEDIYDWIYKDQIGQIVDDTNANY